MSSAPEQSRKPSGDWSQLLFNKVVIVTGAGGAIGAAISHCCVLHGARVAIADINKKAADAVVTKIITDDQTQKDNVMGIELDVTDEQAIQKAVKTIVDKWNRVDVLVNNAAIFTLRSIEEASAEAWSEIFNVNVRGYALMAKAVVPLMKKQRSGSIIQMASISSWIAQPNFVPYSTTKGAVLQMTRNLALDLGSFNIRCNSICPGTILTQATTTHAANLQQTMDEFTAAEVKKQCLKRLGSPEEIANLTVFLASDLCHFATGASFVADGGYTTI
ncbi:unnamed protein product [Rotaria magnacalcarata]|uniref:Uncharacterized protein n=1 Tax=Rotaria magnacalcarata TaxID=392030 RepID=A0A816G9G7_9BILA|nr:unnamed protein product [Rotaria magnacalcarata]CAF1671318.1 unnamed protein product [Rotaria magnacalcarata]CAF2116264.1 unnamed protein product [Rotaria magnacalcarata]CAF3762803.1 unnamed protein product [Rotaria magnacalcarata]CAF3814089.1 unnamed protein product [Rotaria magnacalcarata]